MTICSIQPTKTGYTFLGWSTSSTATSANYSSNQSFSADLTTTDGATVTLYAVWKQNTPTTTEVEISEGITHIGDRSFYNCILIEKVTIPNSVD